MVMTGSPLSEADREALAVLLYPDAPAVEEIAARYPQRALPAGAVVTRFGPSPTGFVHIGSILTALLNWKLAQQSNGVFILRIEDTDRKREVEGGTVMIVRALAGVGLDPDEAPIASRSDSQGAYGPYLQSERLPIYRAYARDFVRRGIAYPCFLGEDELREIREAQQKRKLATGVFGEWARFRNASVSEVEKRLAGGERFVLRLRSPAGEGQRIKFKDRCRGVLDLPANPMDTVLLKSDGFPTYHFAHPIDDTLMGVTLVIRGDEWISTTPIHLQIFAGMNVGPPSIAHIAPVAKMDGGSRRKLSKRLDPEASMDFYHRAGYPDASIVEYLLNLLDSSFEGWRVDNPDRSYDGFELSIDNLGRSSALFNLAKLNSVSQEVVARFPAEDLFAAVRGWAEAYHPALEQALLADPAFAKRALNIGRDNDPPRKDIAAWSDVPTRFGFFFQELFESMVPACYAELPELRSDDIVRVLQYFCSNLSAGLQLTHEAWFLQVKQHAVAEGFADTAGAYKKNPQAFKGKVGDFMMVLRVAITGSRRSPDLHDVMKILGESAVQERLQRCIQFVNPEL